MKNSSSNKKILLQISELKGIQNSLSGISIDLQLIGDLTKSFKPNTHDVIVAAAKIGLDYVQLWHKITDSNKIEMGNVTSKRNALYTSEIKKEFQKLLRHHRIVFNNKLNVAKDISYTLYKVAVATIV